MQPNFTTVDALVLFIALPFWLLVGHLLVARWPNLVRYAWGASGGAVAGLFLLWHHHLENLTWLPVLGLVSGLGATALIYLADAIRAVWRYAKGGGAVFHPVFIERLWRAWWPPKAGR